MNISRHIAVVASFVAVSAFGASPAFAAKAPVGPSIVAPAADGSDSSADGPATIEIETGATALAPGGAIAPLALNLCSPNNTWHEASGTVVNSGRVTTWDKHYKNDSTSETFTWTTSNSVSVTASASVSGTATASVGIKKIAEVGLGITTNYGLQGQVASTTSYSRSVTFNSPGTWVIYAGVETGSGTVKNYKCASTGASYSAIGTVSAFTFDKARTTGLINCANAVTGVVAVNAKTRCS